MMRRQTLRRCFVAILAFGLLAGIRAEEEETAKSESKKEPGIYATLSTSSGDIEIKLHLDKAPIASETFASLAEGKREWTDPKTHQQVRRPFYDGLIFHKVIPGFMIVSGCPLGTGEGRPGFTFEDEIDPSLHFDRPGRMALVNTPHVKSSNGSQFFITVAPAPWLDGKHTIFGDVIGGMDIVEKISQAPTTGETGQLKNKPLQDIILTKVTITRIEPPPPPMPARGTESSYQSESSYRIQTIRQP
ncbi:MAG: peptidylprolyl isomerase [bacterium]